MTAAWFDSDLRCVRCARGHLSSAESKLWCGVCSAEYSEIWGVPFIAAYERPEIISLIEVTANISNRGKFGVTPSVVEELENTLAAYHIAPDKAAFLVKTQSPQAPYLSHRYGEWQELRVLTEGIELRGRRVLDMGAGLGFDSQRLALRGEEVTALEFSPVLAEWGAENFPHMRWVGGLAHALPFQSGSFDAVFCNAAMHHFGDIPAAVPEGLRVLREGGVMITTCDSFRPDGADELSEAQIFNNDPAVLMGVNERVPRFREFADKLLEYREHIDVEIYTHTLYNAPAASGEQVTLTDLTPWDFDKDYAMLSARSGSLALKITLKRATNAAPRLISDTVLEPREFAAVLTDSAAAVARLSPLVPSSYINMPFPGEAGAASKFELLNGWRLPAPQAPWRSAYKRGRWFLRRNPREHYLHFDVRAPGSPEQGDVSVEVLLNGCLAQCEKIARGAWQRFNLDVTSCEAGATFALEIRADTGSDRLGEACFDVRHRRFGSQPNGSRLDQAIAAITGVIQRRAGRAAR